MDYYQQFIHLSRYSRWIEEEHRRETWGETISRYFNFFEKHLLKRCGYTLTKELRTELETAVLNFEIMPSMRCLMTAGKALEKSENAGFNCSFVSIDSIDAFPEIMFLLMRGSGVGFSVRQTDVDKLNPIPEDLYHTDTTIVVEDTTIGWCKAFKELLVLLWSGQIPKWDVSKVRPSGSLLMTYGGRASGPDPLIRVFEFTIKTIEAAKGRRLFPMECHDIATMIGEIIVSGGRRRSALISLSDLYDNKMRYAKAGNWYEVQPYRRMANNSAVYIDKPDPGTFMKEWLSIYDSKSGERGIFNLGAARKDAKAKGFRDASKLAGTNPCGEVILRNCGFCNLSEAVIRSSDTKKDILRKIKLATILGTFQSTLTDFRFLRKVWKKNAEEERLLGVSLTGILDNRFMSSMSEDHSVFLANANSYARTVNAELADTLGIEHSHAITTVKPSGTVSQLVNSSSGIHPRHSEYYIRSVRMDYKDPLTKFMIANGFPNEPDIFAPSQTCVFYFPINSGKQVVTRNELSSIEHLELYKFYKKHWADHNISITVNVKDHEWPSVGAWVYDNFDDINGVSFLPHFESNYKQLPYDECTQEQYEEFKNKMPKNISWEGLKDYENSNNTKTTHEFACTGNSCELE